MDHKCLNCGAAGSDLILFMCEYKGDNLYVCIKCLPGLIHSAH